ncbi:hypothetical protein BJX99DRAFT_94379 [Aspergillus californicus]
MFWPIATLSDFLFHVRLERMHAYLDRLLFSLFARDFLCGDLYSWVVMSCSALSVKNHPLMFRLLVTAWRYYLKVRSKVSTFPIFVKSFKFSTVLSRPVLQLGRPRLYTARTAFLAASSQAQLIRIGYRETVKIQNRKWKISGARWSCWLRVPLWAADM